MFLFHMVFITARYNQAKKSYHLFFYEFFCGQHSSKEWDMGQSKSIFFSGFKRFKLIYLITIVLHESVMIGF